MDEYLDYTPRHHMEVMRDNRKDRLQVEADLLKDPALNNIFHKSIELRLLCNNAGCMPWQGYVKPNGDCQVKVWGRIMSAQRLAWLYHKGTPIPEDKEVVQKCGDLRCMKADHLKLAPYNPRFR